MNRTELLEFYKNHGYLGPVDVFSKAEALNFRAEFFEAMGLTEESKSYIEQDIVNWHMKYAWCHEMAKNPTILDLLEAIFGDPNIVVWSSMIWYKEPDYNKYIPWHQDGAYWSMEPKKTVTVWIALGESTPENGGLRFSPKVHNHIYEHPEIEDPSSQFITHCDQKLAEGRAVNITMQPGQACFFDMHTLHTSGPNKTDKARIGLSFRFTTPEVKFDLNHWQRYKPEICLVRGEDNYHLNREVVGEPPG